MTRTSFLPTLYTLGLGFAGIGALVALTDFRALFAAFVPLVFFAALSMFVKRAGFHVAPQVTHSLVGIVDLAAVFAFDRIFGAWVAAVSGFLYLFLNALRREKHTAFNLLHVPVFNAGLKIGMAYASVHAFEFFGGKIPPTNFSLDDLPALAAAVIAWFVVDHVGWSLLEWTRGGWDAMSNFLRRVLPYSLSTELFPLPFAMVIAVVYAAENMRLLFILLALGLAGTAIIVQRLADTSARLERRRNELSVLNEFGQALAQAGLESEKVVDLFYEHARRIVPADYYRIEFFDRARSTHLHSMLVLEAWNGQLTHPYARSHDTRLADYLSTRREPLRLVGVARSDAEKEIVALFDALRAQHPAAENILCVPLFAGDDLIGALTLLSASPRPFFPIHARNLELMTNQAAVTIQNARLYAAERQRSAQLATISEVSRQVAALLDLDELLESIVTLTRERFGYTNVHIFTVDRDARRAIFRASTHPRGAEWRARGIGYRVGLEGIVGYVAAVGEPLVVNDVSQEPRFVPYPDQVADETRSEIVVPLVIGKKVIGVLDVESHELNAFGDDDLFVLTTLAAQVAAAIERARLGQDVEAKKQLDYELNLARQIQTSFLPAACPAVTGYAIRAWWQSAREVSGDFYDFVQLTGNRLGITIADVSDKGMAAALFMVLSRTILRTMVIGKPTAREAIERANDVILADARSEMFVTVLYAVLDPTKHKLTYVNAGHIPPLFYCAAKKELRTLKEHGIALGVIPNVVMEEKSVALDVGDIVLLYTDGVTDAINSAEEEFGTERLAELLRENAPRSADEIIETIQRAVADFAGDGAQFDDVTLVAVKRCE